MRQITIDSINAFLNRDTFSRANMLVENWEGETFLKLHGNTIAILNDEGLFITSAGWETATTKERLNGLPGVSIHQKNYQWFLNGEAWDGELVKA